MTKISLIIPTYQREAYLIDTLKCAFIQDFDSFEIIVVDQTEVLQKETLKFLEIHKNDFQYIRLNEASLTLARNTGIRASRGGVIVMIDDDTLLVAYNLSFDIGFLLKLYQKYVFRNYSIPFDILDCMAVYKDRYPFPHRLESAAATFKIENENAHRASDDAKTTFEVLMKLQEQDDNLNLYVNVLGYNPKYRPPDTYFFKKMIRLVPQGMNGTRDIEKVQRT